MKQQVKPNTGARESLWISLTVVAILLFATLALPHHQVNETTQALEIHQRSVKDLQQQDLSLIHDLKIAHEEIRAIYTEIEAWPDIEALTQEWIFPFVEDKSWQYRGAHTWTFIGNALYLGTSSDQNGAASMLLDTQYDQPVIWLSHQKDNHQVLNEALVRFSAQHDKVIDVLKQYGWQEVIFNQPSSHHGH